jgi:hypothetical protein
MPKKQASDQGNIHRQEWTQGQGQGQGTHPHIRRRQSKRTPNTIAKAIKDTISLTMVSGNYSVKF